MWRRRDCQGCRGRIARDVNKTKTVASALAITLHSDTATHITRRRSSEKVGAVGRAGSLCTNGCHCTTACCKRGHDRNITAYTHLHTISQCHSVAHTHVHTHSHIQTCTHGYRRHSRKMHQRLGRGSSLSGTSHTRPRKSRDGHRQHVRAKRYRSCPTVKISRGTRRAQRTSVASARSTGPHLAVPNQHRKLASAVASQWRDSLHSVVRQCTRVLRTPDRQQSWHPISEGSPR